MRSSAVECFRMERAEHSASPILHIIFAAAAAAAAVVAAVGIMDFCLLINESLQ